MLQANMTWPLVPNWLLSRDFGEVFCYNQGMSQLLPLVVTKYFWGDNLVELNWSHHQAYITQTLLEKGDALAMTWLFNQLTKSQLNQLLPILKLTPRSRQFWKIYLS